MFVQPKKKKWSCQGDDPAFAWKESNHPFLDQKQKTSAEFGSKSSGHEPNGIQKIIQDMLKIGKNEISSLSRHEKHAQTIYIYISKCSFQPKSHQLSFCSLHILTLRCPASVLGNAWNWEKWWSPGRSGWPMAIFERVQRVDTSWVEIDKLSGTDR